MSTEYGYFRALNEDIDRFNPAYYTNWSMDGYTFASEVIFGASYILSQSKATSHRPDISELQTDFGKRIHAMHAAGFRFFDTVHYGGERIPGICSDAETGMVQSLDVESIYMPHTLSPLIVTIGDQPVAFGKNEGAPTFYGLENVPEYNIVSGALHWFRGAVKAQNLPPNRGAYKTDLTQPLHTVPEVLPLRFSFHAAPLADRMKLNYRFNYQKKVHELSHEDVIETCTNLLEDARPVKIDDELQLAAACVPDYLVSY